MKLKDMTLRERREWRRDNDAYPIPSEGAQSPSTPSISDLRAAHQIAAEKYESLKRTKPPFLGLFSCGAGKRLQDAETAMSSASIDLGEAKKREAQAESRKRYYPSGQPYLN